MMKGFLCRWALVCVCRSERSGEDEWNRQAQDGHRGRGDPEQGVCVCVSVCVCVCVCVVRVRVCVCARAWCVC